MNRDESFFDHTLDSTWDDDLFGGSVEVEWVEGPDTIEDLSAFVPQTAEVVDFEEDTYMVFDAVDDGFDDEFEEDEEEELTEFEDFTLLQAPSSNRGKRVFWVGVGLCLAILVGVSLVDIWAQGEATRLGFVYGQSLQELDKMREEKKRLEIRLASLRNPARLARIARTELGLRQPRRSQLLSEEQVREQLEQKQPENIRLAQRPQVLQVSAQ